MTMLSCGSCCAMCLSLGVEDENWIILNIKLIYQNKL